MVVEDLDAAEIRGWAVGLSALHQRIGKHFVRAEPRQLAYDYLQALLSPIERKNGWQIAEHVGAATPDGVQRLLATAHWDADHVRDDLRSYVVEHLGHPEAVLVIDETGFLKKGTKSVGVKRQYSGTAGRIENCQIGVFLAYASPWGRTFLDRELYLPEEWATDAERRNEAGVPPAVAFATKPQIARRMLARACQAGVPAAWVTADSVYGGDFTLRKELTERKQRYVVAVSSTQALWVWDNGVPQQRSIREVVARVAPNAWVQLSAGDGAKGPRVYDWTWGVVRESAFQEGWLEWWVARRSVSDPTDIAYYLACAPADTVLQTIVQVAGTRWAVEESLETAKGEVGLDQYEVRKWTGWYRHITLALLAHAFLTVTRAQVVGRGDQKGGACTLMLP
ncbi:MAG: IS701 family transposase [Chloroflexota bacterium]|jgi:SRSO17 transposase|nr:IS701 family transposase [Chloroflexota bacterium]